jgi:energy-converting hydrogenase Eha subunit A
MFQELLTNGNFLITLAIALVAMTVVGIVTWREKQPRQSLEPSLVPATPVILFSGIVALLAIVHLVNLLGVHTGR